MCWIDTLRRTYTSCLSDLEGVGEVYKSFLSDKYAGRIEDYTGQKQEVGYLTERIEGS
ncbi:MAG: hypothetical protein NTAFB01_00470 [Nitrospira sp.]